MDSYSKFIFTVIALSLSVIAYQGLEATDATAQSSHCGNDEGRPCFVNIVYGSGRYRSRSGPVWVQMDTKR
ncbi:hypothetical protein [uncultured Roseibium sp.]|uniref:hypothetical protein n=1 Tax=uncultured Roseibium sp. TaxID=1936171 RepID=UPI00321683E7